MMNNKKMIFATLLGVAMLTVSASTFAYQGNPGVANDDCTDPERKVAVENMFENSDYTAFQELYSDKGVAKKVTSKESFQKFVELRNANLSGDTDKATSLKTELGLGQKRMDGTGGGNGQGNGEKRGNGNGQGRK